MDRLTRLENDAVYIIREAYARSRRTAILWSMGKDSTVLLWLCMKAFLGRIPVPVVHIDTGYKFPQMYAYRDRWAEEWGLDVRVFTCPTASPRVQMAPASWSAAPSARPTSCAMR